ncbi:hypothetical protein C8R45DRAFT_1220429 [Mycena sanguinolenta]|nr:hypothetical protein C8R45DRAFT_1220429 [Mycena sanguinolenta]
MSASPSLPLELEREIFEICALSRPVSIPKLMLVAQRVKEWVEPLLYRTILLGVDIPGPPAFLHNAVRGLLTTSRDSARELEMILRLCTGVENLWIPNADETLMLLIESLPLKRLAAAFEFMPPPTSQMFARLTHLYLLVLLGEIVDSVRAFVVALPTLTHLSLPHLSFSFDVSENEEIVFPTIHRILESSPSMQVLVIFTDSMISLENKVPPDVRRDVRFVVMLYRGFAADWYAGILHDKDFWRDAETFIAKRRTREIDPLKFSWP